MKNKSDGDYDISDEVETLFELIMTEAEEQDCKPESVLNDLIKDLKFKILEKIKYHQNEIYHQSDKATPRFF